MTTPRPFHYCRICHRNFTDYEWKKHRFNPKHKQRLEDKLADVEVSLEHLLSPTDDVTLQDLDFDATSFECYFCEDYSLLKNAVEEGHDSTASDVTAIWTHLAGEKHRAVVQHYFAEYSPPPLYQPHRYWLKKSLLKFKLAQYARVKRARDHEGDHLLTLVTRDSESEQQSRATPLTQPSDSVLSNYTLPDTHMTREVRTVWSKDGIAQNPTGWHQGARVWGGGIVPVRAEEWRAWPIDLDDETSALTAQDSVLGESSRVRTIARTTNKLATIHVDPDLAKKGNIHTGARPPWETEEDAAGPQVGPTVNVLALAREQQRIQHKNPHRVGAEHANRVRLEQQGVNVGEQPEDADSSWLPKFGRVFNAGSRADSRKEFEREQRKRKLDQR